MSDDQKEVSPDFVTYTGDSIAAQDPEEPEEEEPEEEEPEEEPEQEPEPEEVKEPEPEKTVTVA